MTTRMGGHPTGIFVSQPVDDNLICPICWDVYREAVSVCIEGHILCRDCYDLHVAAGGDCPSCRQPLEHPHKVGFLNSVIEKLEVKCGVDGCQWKGPLRDFDDHQGGCPVLLKNQISKLKKENSFIRSQFYHETRKKFELKDRVQKQRKKITNMKAQAQSSKCNMVKQLNDQRKKISDLEEQLQAMLAQNKKPDVVTQLDHQRKKISDLKAKAKAKAKPRPKNKKSKIVPQLDPPQQYRMPDLEVVTQPDPPGQLNPQKMKIFVKKRGEIRPVAFDVRPSDTVHELKNKIDATSRNSGASGPSLPYFLSYKGTIMFAERTLSSYKIKEGCNIDVNHTSMKVREHRLILRLMRRACEHKTLEVNEYPTE